MPNLLVKTTLNQDTLLNEDKVTNSFAVLGAPDLLSATLTGVKTSIVDFYNGVASGALNAMADFLSPSLDASANGARIQIYDLTGHEGGAGVMGAPVHDSTWTLVPGVTVGYPSEVAFAITLEADAISQNVEIADGADADNLPDRPRQRHTGRIYWGPLSSNTGTVADGAIRPASNIRDTARLAIDNLDEDLFVNAGGARLGVWSRKDGVVRRVTHVSVDNAFDTQRRRGNKPTLRQRTAL